MRAFSLRFRALTLAVAAWSITTAGNALGHLAQQIFPRFPGAVHADEVCIGLLAGGLYWIRERHRQQYQKLEDVHRKYNRTLLSRPLTRYLLDVPHILLAVETVCARYGIE